jgi:hypothetical protein
MTTPRDLLTRLEPVEEVFAELAESLEEALEEGAPQPLDPALAWPRAVEGIIRWCHPAVGTKTAARSPSEAWYYPVYTSTPPTFS